MSRRCNLACVRRMPALVHEIDEIMQEHETNRQYNDRDVNRSYPVQHRHVRRCRENVNRSELEPLTRSGMAFAACLRQVRCIDVRTGVARWPDIMDAVAARAVCCRQLPRTQSQTMETVLKCRYLICR